MAQTIQFSNVASSGSSANVSAVGATLLFADQVLAVHSNDTYSLNVTSRFALGDGASLSGYVLIADDSASEIQFEQSVGKFVDGNLIAGFAPLTEIKSDVRDYIYYPSYDVAGSGFFTGVCNSTQTQDYTPALVANSRAILMISPQQAASLSKNVA